MGGTLRRDSRVSIAGLVDLKILVLQSDSIQVEMGKEMEAPEENEMHKRKESSDMGDYGTIQPLLSKSVFCQSRS